MGNSASRQNTENSENDARPPVSSRSETNANVSSSSLRRRRLFSAMANDRSEDRRSPPPAPSRNNRRTRRRLDQSGRSVAGVDDETLTASETNDARASDQQNAFGWTRLFQSLWNRPIFASQQPNLSPLPLPDQRQRTQSYANTPTPVSSLAETSQQRRRRSPRLRGPTQQQQQRQQALDESELISNAIPFQLMGGTQLTITQQGSLSQTILRHALETMLTQLRNLQRPIEMTDRSIGAFYFFGSIVTTPLNARDQATATPAHIPVVIIGIREAASENENAAENEGSAANTSNASGNNVEESQVELEETSADEENPDAQTRNVREWLDRRWLMYIIGGPRTAEALERVNSQNQASTTTANVFAENDLAEQQSFSFDINDSTDEEAPIITAVPLQQSEPTQSANDSARQRIEVAIQGRIRILQNLTSITIPNNEAEAQEAHSTRIRRLVTGMLISMMNREVLEGLGFLSDNESSSTNDPRMSLYDTYELFLRIADMVGPARPRYASKEELEKSVPAMTFAEWRQLHPDTSNDDLALSCRICLDEYKNDDQLRLLPCQHAFHKDCIDAWVSQHVNCCPLCRVEVVAKTSSEQEMPPADG